MVDGAVDVADDVDHTIPSDDDDLDDWPEHKREEERVRRKKEREKIACDKVLVDVNAKFHDRQVDQANREEWARLRTLIPEGMDERLVAAIKAANVEKCSPAMVEHGYDDTACIQAMHDVDLQDMARDVDMSLNAARFLALRLRTSVPVTAGATIPPEQRRCLVCWKSEKLKACARCKGVYFCGVECQKVAWPGHKAPCAAAAPKWKPKPPPEEACLLYTSPSPRDS